MILTWYIFRQTFSNVFISTLVFVGIIWLSQSFKSIKLIVNKGAGLSDFFILSAYSIPSWLLIAIPFGTFAGSMISYLKFQSDRELLVMKSAGINNLKLSKPAFLIAILASLILFFISHFVMPKTYKHFKTLQNEIRNSSPNFIIKDNIFVDVNDKQTIFVSKFNEQNELEEIFIQDRSDPSSIVEFFSKKGYLKFEKNLILSMSDGIRISTNLKGTSTLLNFKFYDIEINKKTNGEKNKEIKPRLVEYNEYDFFELLNKSNNAGKNKGKFLAEAHSRNTIILMPLVFSFIVMVTLLKDNLFRIFSSYRKTVAIGLLVFVQSLVLIIKNAVHFNTIFLPLMYIFPIFILTISIILLFDSGKNYKHFWFFKNNY
tara:strand:+ start:20 stop:1138 length:1119 start_codon:yes stop_codon:yes gene_type:complete